MTVSVLLSAFNAVETIGVALDSILAQTHRDFELVVVDDGSSDGTAGIIDAAVARDDRVRVLHQPNAGLVVSLNRGLGLCRYEFVARMDADDRAWPERLERQAAYLNANPQVVAVGSQTRIIDSGGRPVRQGWYPTDPHAAKASLRSASPFAHPAVMMRRSVVESVGGYRAAFIHAEDYDLWLRMGEVGDLANIPAVLLDYRVHGNNTSTRNAADQAFSTAAAWVAHLLRSSGRPEPLSLLDRGVGPQDLAALLQEPDLSEAFEARRVYALVNNGGVLASNAADAGVDGFIQRSGSQAAGDLAARAALVFARAGRYREAAAVAWAGLRADPTGLAATMLRRLARANRAV